MKAMQNVKLAHYDLPTIVPKGYLSQPSVLYSIKEFAVVTVWETRVLVGLCTQTDATGKKVMCRKGSNMETLWEIPEHCKIEKATASDLLELEGVADYSDIVDTFINAMKEAGAQVYNNMKHGRNTSIICSPHTSITMHNKSAIPLEFNGYMRAVTPLIQGDVSCISDNIVEFEEVPGDRFSERIKQMEDLNLPRIPKESSLILRNGLYVLDSFSIELLRNRLVSSMSIPKGYLGSADEDSQDDYYLYVKKVRPKRKVAVIKKPRIIVPGFCHVIPPLYVIANNHEHVDLCCGLVRPPHSLPESFH